MRIGQLIDHTKKFRTVQKQRKLQIKGEDNTSLLKQYHRLAQATDMVETRLDALKDPKYTETQRFRPLSPRSQAKLIALEKDRSHMHMLQTELIQFTEDQSDTNTGRNELQFSKYPIEDTVTLVQTISRTVNLRYKFNTKKKTVFCKCKKNFWFFL